MSIKELLIASFNTLRCATLTVGWRCNLVIMIKGWLTPADKS